MSRVGNWLLCAGGLVLAALMAYILAFDNLVFPSWKDWGRRSGVYEVAVFFPSQTDWVGFRRGIQVCQDRGLARRIDDTGDSMVVETTRQKRRIRFAFHDVRGVQVTKKAVDRLVSNSPPPIALVGSNNTVLTVALAEALRDSAEDEAEDGPVLLVPWASSVLVDSPEPEGLPVPLLGIDPGRTFRFCPNNQVQADLVVRCLLEQDPPLTPARAFILVDRHDAYSADLAECFQRSIDRTDSKAEVIQDRKTLAFSGMSHPFVPPTTAELELARKIWGRATATPNDQTTWVVLPVQGDPARRMIAALHVKAPFNLGPGDGPLRVVVGDGIGLKSLSELAAGKLSFPIFCVSSASLPDPGGAAGGVPADGAQIPAEIVSALIHCLDSPRVLDATALRVALATLHIPAGDRAAMGRPIDFGRSGEREGMGLGHVMSIRPGSAEVHAMARVESGKWSQPVPVRPAEVSTPQ